MYRKALFASVAVLISSVAIADSPAPVSTNYLNNYYMHGQLKANSQVMKMAKCWGPLTQFTLNAEPGVQSLISSMLVNNSPCDVLRLLNAAKSIEP